MTGKQIRILIACTIGSVFGYATLGVVAFSLIVSPLNLERGWSVEEIGFGVTLMSVVAIFAVPVTGNLIDRFGCRLVITASVFLTATLFTLFALVPSSLSTFYVFYAVLPLCASGTLSTSYTRVITTNFDAKRGLAIGVIMSGTGVGAIILPLLLNSVIQDFGVQGAYLALAGLVLLSGLPAIFLLDGDTTSERSNIASKSSDLLPMAKKSLATKVGVKMLGLCVLLGIYTGATWAVIVPVMLERGISQEQAVLAMTYLSIALLAARLFAGFLLDHFFAPFVAAAFILPVVVGWAALSMGVSGVGVIVCAILLGIGMGAEFDFLAYLTGKYFPRKAYSTIYGIFYSMFSLGGAAAPLILYFSPDRTVSMGIFATVAFIAVVLLLSYGPYQETSEAELGSDPSVAL